MCKQPKSKDSQAPKYSKWYDGGSGNWYFTKDGKTDKNVHLHLNLNGMNQIIYLHYTNKLKLFFPVVLFDNGKWDDTKIKNLDEPFKTAAQNLKNGCI